MDFQDFSVFFVTHLGFLNYSGWLVSPSGYFNFTAPEFWTFVIFKVLAD